MGMMKAQRRQSITEKDQDGIGVETVELHLKNQAHKYRIITNS